MPFSIEYKNTQDYYRVDVFGEDAKQDYIGLKTGLLSTTGSSEPKIKVLFNLFDSQRTNMSKQEQFDLIAEIADGTLKNIKIALIMPKVLDDQNDWYFLVEMSKNLGINVKPFYVEDKALAWLLS